MYKVIIMVSYRSWRRGTGIVIGYILFIIKALGKVCDRSGFWRMSKIRIFERGGGEGVMRKGCRK